MTLAARGVANDDSLVFSGRSSCVCVAALLTVACAATDGKALPPDHGPLDCPEGFVRNTSIPAPWCSRIHSLPIGNPCSDTTACAEGLYCDMDRGWTCQTTVSAR